MLKDHIFKPMSSPRPMVDTGLPEASADWALFLDIDGTLLDLAPTPDSVTVPKGLLPVLGELAGALDGALAVVSGRPVEWIDRMFAPLSLPAAGLHGAELRACPHGAVQEIRPARDLAPICERVAAAVAGWSGVVLEDKGISLALHYRLAPERADAVRVLMEAAAAEAGEWFHLLPGKMVFEIKPRASTKGRAVATLMEISPFAGRRPVFIGDDRTDEDGFREAMARGGHAVQVGPGDSPVAPYRVAGPSALREWLAGLPGALRGAA